MALAKRIYILMIKVNKLFLFFSSLCFLKEIVMGQWHRRNACMLVPCSIKISTLLSNLQAVCSMLVVRIWQYIKTMSHGWRFSWFSLHGFLTICLCFKEKLEVDHSWKLKVMVIVKGRLDRRTSGDWVRVPLFKASVYVNQSGFTPIQC